MIKRLRTAWVLVHLVVATLIFAILILLTAPLDRSKRFIGWWPRLWSRWILWSTGLEITYRGVEQLQSGQKYIYMSNHTSALDIALAFSVLPGTVVFLAKKELFRIVFFGWAMWALGCIPVDRLNRAGARQAVDRALRDLETKRLSLLIFPEGTRTRDGRLLPFKKGGFLLALRSGLPVVPMAIQGALEAVPPGAMSLTHTPVRLTIGAPIATDSLTDDDRDDLLQRTYHSIHTLFAQT
ncbi:MAG: 1-acyl-sn-glycerol-3-phosphate acyltransferase [Candidatus Marinimicrobia bacterium]|nr:1-acyl-sn-glycerol-3-phosphate acyltransferase [Candidatus Neomarinimicrobiota bacterium]